tara:strand:+ start:329 stop:526 length:198 start_codon:yes stop_codon:yes gene_type:complete
MDFGVLFIAIGIVAMILSICGILIGWVSFVDRMIKNTVLNMCVCLLPVITFGVILFYGKIQQLQS